MIDQTRVVTNLLEEFATRHGLHYRLSHDGPGIYTAEIGLGPAAEGYPGLVHGGFLATVADSMSARVADRVLGGRAFTTALNIQYLHAAPLTAGTLYVASSPVAVRDGRAVIQTSITDEHAKPYAHSTATFRRPAR